MNNRNSQSAFELTPNQRLARDIAAKLIAEGLINASHRAKLEAGLAEGDLGAADWRVFIELAADRKSRQS